jgi:hypothetical protein
LLNVWVPLRHRRIAMPQRLFGGGSVSFASKKLHPF